MALGIVLPSLTRTMLGLTVSAALRSAALPRAALEGRYQSR